MRACEGAIPSLLNDAQRASAPIKAEMAIEHGFQNPALGALPRAFPGCDMGH